MKKSFLIILAFCFLGLISQEAFAVEENCTGNTCPVAELAVSAENNDEIAKTQINEFIEKLAEFQNKHSLWGLKRLYMEEFVNADGFNREQLFKLMKSTFANYSDIKTDFKVENIVVTGDYAMVYLNQSITATTKEASKITGDKGEYNAQLNGILYLKRINNIWKIYSEEVLFENSTLAFGSAKGVKSVLNAPQKVFANTDYCAGVWLDLPEKYMATASINNTQVVDGFNLAGETFRAVNANLGIVERILKSNSDNNNEAVVISVALTERSQDMFKKPKVEISGLLMLMKRVDVIPVNSNFKEQKDK